MRSLLIAILVSFTAATAYSSETKFFRPWQGYKKAELTTEQFLKGLYPFTQKTPVLYKEALNQYLVIVSPGKRPATVPEEFALIALTSEEEYQKIRSTPEGKAYGDAHWEIFDQEKSKSATIASINDKELKHNHAYDLSPAPLDWSKGHLMFYIGTRKGEQKPEEFLARLRKHMIAVRDTWVPMGLKGYIVIAANDYEVAYLNWKSKADMDKAMKSDAGKAVTADSATFLEPLVWESPKKVGKSYSVGGVYKFK